MILRSRFMYIFVALMTVASPGCGNGQNSVPENKAQPQDSLQSKVRGAQIVAFKWGEITVKGTDGKVYNFKDAKLWPKSPGASHWNWEDTGTRHNPGILVADVVKILDKAIHSTIVILSKGVDEVLQTAPQTVAYLEEQKRKKLIKAYHILQTEKAIKLYNELNEQGESVVGLFHSTC